jgi:RHS repeat-associated protein
MTYNLANQMTHANGNSYTYDGFNRRVKTNSNEFSAYSQEGQLLFRQEGSIATQYMYLGSRLVAKKKSQTVSYLHTDILGSVIAETNGSKTVQSRSHYKAFGDTVAAPQDDVGYTGHKFDADLGLSYMQARYYDPVIGRFYSNDPVGYTNKNPVMSFNRYLYVNNNPYKYTDPDGEFLWGIGIGAVIGAGIEAFEQHQAGNGFDGLKIMEEAAKGALLGLATGGVGNFANALAKADKLGTIATVAQTSVGASTGALIGTGVNQAIDATTNAIFGKGFVTSTTPTENLSDMVGNMAGAGAGNAGSSAVKVLTGAGSGIISTTTREATSTMVSEAIKTEIEAN